MRAVTTFSQYTVAQLNQMLDQSDPASLSNTAQAWDSVGTLLHEQANNLESQLGSLGTGWSGTAATDYTQMMTDLASGMRTVADTAFAMRDLTYNALDALDTARAEMPGPVDVPVLSPATMALAAKPVQVTAGMSPLTMLQLQQQQAAAVQAVEAQQQATATATAAQTQAVAVMQTLAGSYVTEQAAIPPSPGSAVPTALSSPSAAGASATDTSAFTGLLAAPGDVITSPSPTDDSSQSSGLFGNMYTIGLAAIAAVTGGVGALALGSPASSKNAAAAGSSAALAGAAMPSAAVLGGGVIGGAISKATGMTGGSAAAEASEAAAASETASSQPMMPMMPMGGMGGVGGEGGGSRRLPPWLVEREDVWGASFPAAPGLVGG
jgi:uncharacterized protein YukE